MTWIPEPDDQGRLYDTYEVEIQRVADGEIRRRDFKQSWHSSSMFWWVDGNGACDCNRELEFARAGDEDEPEDVQCGDSRYRVLRAIFPDGTSVQIDDSKAR